MAKVAVLFLISVFLQVATPQSTYNNDILRSDVGGEEINNLDKEVIDHSQSTPSEDVSLSQTVLLKKLSANSHEYRNDAKLDPVKLMLSNSDSENYISNQDFEDDTIQNNLEKSKLFQRLARKADSGNDVRKTNKSGPHKVSILKPAVKKVDQKGYNKQARILGDMRKVTRKEIKNPNTPRLEEAPELDILEVNSAKDEESNFSEDSEETTAEPQEDIPGESVKMEVDLQKDEKDAEDSSSVEEPSEPPIIETSSVDETPISADSKKSKSSLNLDLLERTRNHMLDVIKPVPESNFAPNLANCDVYCFRQYYLQYGNNLYCCYEYTKSDVQINFNTHNYRPCPQCNCCVQNHYVQQNNFVQQNYAPTHQQHVSYQQHYVPAHQQHYVPAHQQHYVPAQQNYVPAQQHYVPAQQHYVPAQQHYVQNQQYFVPSQHHYVPDKQYPAPIQPAAGNYYWPYMYDHMAQTYKPYYK